MRRRSSLLAAVSLAGSLGLSLFASAGSASATQLQATANSFTGDPLQVSLRVDDAVVPGDLVITLTVVGPGTTKADLRGFFLNVADESLLAGLSISGTSVTSHQIGANSVIAVGNGNNLNGGGTPCPCDLGVELGTAGIGKDDLRTVTFTLSHATANLDVSFVASQTFGVRATSVGSRGCREGSSKLVGTIPVVPEPGTALLMGLGLAGLAAGRRTRVA